MAFVYGVVNVVVFEISKDLPWSSVFRAQLGLDTRDVKFKFHLVWYGTFVPTENVIKSNFLVIWDNLTFDISFIT